MSHTLKNLLFTVVISISVAVITTPSYAKDEADNKPQSTKVEKTEKKKTEKTSKNNDKEAKKTGEKKKNETTSNTKKDSNNKSAKLEKNSSEKNNKTTDKPKGQKRATTNTGKKQFKNIIVNLNKADAKTFSYYLMGIGEVRAKAIVAYRKNNGKFKDIKELLKVEGIGQKIFAGLEKNVSLTKGKESVPKTEQSTAKKGK